jgi:hypothetical protein
MGQAMIDSGQMLAADLALDPVGRPIVAGAPLDGSEGLTVARFSASGQLDPSFGEMGLATIPVPGGQATTAAARADSGVVVAGSVQESATIQRPAVGVLDANGEPIAGPGVLGGTPNAAGTALADVRGALAAKHGREYLVGTGYSSRSCGQPFVARVDQDLALDESFGTNGFVTYPKLPCGYLVGAASAGKGRVVAAGTSRGRIFAFMVGANGNRRWTGRQPYVFDRRGVRTAAFDLSRSGRSYFVGGQVELKRCQAKRKACVGMAVIKLTRSGRRAKGFGSDGIAAAPHLAAPSRP